MDSGYGKNCRHYEHYDRRLYGRPHYGLNVPRAASIHAASSVHTLSRRSGGTLMRAGADAQSVVREERRKRAKTRCLVTIGVLLPAMAGIIGVVAYAVSADNYGRTTLNRPTPNPVANVRQRPPLKDSLDLPSQTVTGYPAENRMDAFETKSASNNVPIKRLSPHRTDFHRQPEINSLNSGIHPPAAAAQDDPLQRRFPHDIKLHQATINSDSTLPNKVYFDREQPNEPLRHGDGTPESTFVGRRSQADPPYAQRVQPLVPMTPHHPPPVVSEPVIFQSVNLASSSPNPVQTVPIKLQPHRPPIPVLTPDDVKLPTPTLASKTNQLEHSDNEFTGVVVPTGMQEQQITVVDSLTGKAYMIHFLVSDNDRNPDGSIAGFDPTSPSFQQYIRDIIRQQDQQHAQQRDQQVVVLPDITASATDAPPPASSSEPTSASTATTSTTTTTTTTTTTINPPPSQLKKSSKAPATINKAEQPTISTTAPSTTTSAKPRVASPTRTQRRKAPTPSPPRNIQSGVPPVRPRIQGRLQPKTTTSSTTTRATTTSTTTETRENSQEYDESEADEEIDELIEPDEPAEESRLSPPPPPLQDSQQSLTEPEANFASSSTIIEATSKANSRSGFSPLSQGAASMETLSSSPSGFSMKTPQHQSIPSRGGIIVLSSTTTTRRPKPSGPKPIFYSEANRRDTNLSSQNPFRPPSPRDFRSAQNPPAHPPAQRFSSSNQRAVFANAPFKPPSPPSHPAFLPLPTTFRHQLMGAESQLGLSRVHVLPDGGLLLPALGPQYPPTIQIPPPTSKPKSNGQISSSETRLKSKHRRTENRKKQNKDQRFGIELGGSDGDHDDEGSGISFSIGGGGSDRKHRSPLSIAKHIFLPFLPRPKVNLNKRVVFGVVLENATKLSHKKSHHDGGSEAVADISLNGHAIHDHS